MEIKMNNYKYDYPKLPLIIIFFAGIPYAIVIKSQTLYKFQDLGSANMILVTVLFFWCFLYWAFVDSTFNLITIFRNKIKFFQQDKSAMKIKDTLRDHSQISSVENIVKEDKLPIVIYQKLKTIKLFYLFMMAQQIMCFICLLFVQKTEMNYRNYNGLLNLMNIRKFCINNWILSKN